MKKEGEQVLKVCPNCKSVDVRTQGSTYTCNNCRYSSTDFLDVAKSSVMGFDKKPHKKKTATDHRKDNRTVTPHGDLFARIIIESIALISLIFGILFIKYDVEPITGIILVGMGATIFFITYFRKFHLLD